MELKYPLVLGIVLFLLILIVIFGKKQKRKFKNGLKIANTKYLKESVYYHNLMKKYHLLKNLVLTSLLIAIGACSFLVARLTKIETFTEEQYNRDVMICMDVSTSVDELNLELIESLKKTVGNLEGERFGISIFNTSSVLLSPLTDDYDYIISILDNIKKSINLNNDLSFSFNDERLYLENYIISGTLVNNETRGSSLIGDGLASCVYDFSNLDEERTRLIIFSTDNDLAGKPIATLDEAANISLSKNIKVFGIGTAKMQAQKQQEFQNAVLKTGGKFYEQSSSLVANIVNDIEQSSKSLLKKESKTKRIDIPKVPFIILIISLSIFIIFSKQVM